MLLSISVGLALLTAPQTSKPEPQDPGAGDLQIVGKDGKPGLFCPLEGTKVRADIAGFGARVTVIQTFTNPSKEVIEAVYTFPLPADAAVDQMNMRIGSRLIQGEIKRREEARRIYDAAKNAGQAAALLDQERPNIFTQSVANITPGAKVEIEISYVQLLRFEKDQFEFTYPMVVGPRFTGVTPDPGKVTPPITPKGTRTGATIDLEVRLDAGAPITSIDSELHEVKIQQGRGASSAVVKLAKKDEIPNRDFILRYGVANNSVQSAMLTYADQRNGGFFTLILMPPKAPTPEQIVPREMIFVFDQSGSQQGFPIEKSKELGIKQIDALRRGDTFNVMGFNNQVNALWNEPRPNTNENRAAAKKFVQGLQANGGTMLNMAINAAMAPRPDPKRVRLIVFNTDGFVGDDFNILDSIQKHRQHARIFTFGIGNGVNRFLIDAMSAEGKGDSETVTLQADTDKTMDRFLQRTQSPILTDIGVKFEGVTVADVLPAAIPDVFSEKPVIIKGRYTQAGRGQIVVSGILGDKPWSQVVPLNFPDAPSFTNLTEDLTPGGLEANANPQGSRPGNLESAFGQRGSAIATLWARGMIDEVMRSNWLAMYSNLDGQKRSEKEKWAVQAVTNLGLRFGLMTQYTSFVAVEKRVVNIGGKQITVAVPVEMADGVSYEGIFGLEEQTKSRTVQFASTAGLARGGAGGGAGGFGGGGLGGGGGTLRGGQGLVSAAPPASSGPVRWQQGGVTLGKPMELKDEGGRSYSIFWDPQDKYVKVYKEGKQTPIGFNQLKDDEIVALAESMDEKTEAEFLKTIKPEEVERYWFVLKVDKKLRTAKPTESLAVQIWTAEWEPDFEAQLKAAGLKECQASPGLKAAFGAADRAALKKIAALPFVRRVGPLAG